jgi:hypothetical protein
MRSLTNLTSQLIAACAVGAALAHPASASSADDACALLTSAQVGAALGVAVGSGTYVTPTFKKTCTWTATSSGGGTVTLSLQSTELFASGRKLASSGTSVSTTSISGIGDDAYYFGSGKLVSLIVKKGAVALKVAVYAHVPIEKQQAVEKALALQAVLNL